VFEKAITAAPADSGAFAHFSAPLELAVIIPVMNEAANVRPLVARLEAALAGIGWEAIFVDDHSPDGTADAVRALAREDRRIRIVERIGRRGLSSAVVEGMLASAAPVLAVIDGDMQHDEALLPALFACASGGTDIAIGSRYVTGGGVGQWDEGRASASRFATRAANAVLPVAVSDPMSGFFAIRRQAFNAALPHLSGSGFKILLDLIISSPVPPTIAELPYVFRTREHGTSKLDLMVVAEYAQLLADKTVGRIVPVRLLMFLAVGVLGLGVHLSVLGSALSGGVDFAIAQGAAVFTAMTFNFALNNVFTYRDRRLRGWRFVTGLLSFYAVCLVGAAANIGVGAWVHDLHNAWWVAGAAGALVGAVWNYAASSFVTWRR
jgi:dolichol-phosphate mannosyltransferase